MSSWNGCPFYGVAFSSKACQIVRTILPKWPLNQVTQSISRFRQREGLSHDRFDRAGLKQRDDRIPGVNPGRQRLSEKYEALDAGQSGIPLSIGARAIRALIQTQGISDLQRIYQTAQRDGADFNLAYIGSDFGYPHNARFDGEYMRQLFEYAYRLSAKGYPWGKAPPGEATPDHD